MAVFGPAISTEWTSLSRRHAAVLIAAGLVLELPIRFAVRPDASDLAPGNPWFHPWLRLAVEGTMVGLFFALPLLLRAPLPAAGIPTRRWTRWEFLALAIVGGGELLVVMVLVGHRWTRLAEGGLLMSTIPWVVGEFLFGMNQETGFRGLIMTGLLRLRGPRLAYSLNTALFLVGPLHGPGLIEWLASNPLAAMGYTCGVVVHGVAFSWIRHRSDNVVLCALLHGIINGFMNGSGFALRAATAP
jgi:membrane protease YdiL (CAAX protease family)